MSIYKALADSALEHRAKLVTEVRSLNDDKSLTLAEKRERADKINADIEALTAEARAAIEDGEREAEARGLFAKAGGLVMPNGEDGSRTAPRAEARMNQPLPEGRGFADIAGGTATATEFGDFARSMVYGEHRAAEGTDSAGGFLVPTKYAASVLDLARNQAQVVRAGGMLVPLDSDDVRLAKVEADPSAAWRNESSAIAASDITFGEVQFKAKSLAVLVKASFELVEDAANFGSILQNSLAQAFAVKLDSAALYGTGTAPEPKGIKNSAGVTIVPLGANGAALTNWDPMIAGVSAVRTANFQPTGMILAERTEAKLATFKDSQLQYLTAPPYLANIPRFTSGNVPTNLAVGTSGAVTSDVFIGDFSKVGVGVRTNFSMKVLNETFAATGEIGFIGWLRADVQVMRSSAFYVVSGINGS